MDSVIKFLEGLISHSIPTILVIAGIVFLAYPYYIDIVTKKDITDKQKKSARNWGIIFFVAGIGLSLFIKPPESQPQPPFGIVYTIPYLGISTPGVGTESSPTVEIAPPIPTATKEEVAVESTATHTPLLSTPTPTSEGEEPEIVEPPTATYTPLPTPVIPTSTPTPELVTHVIPVPSTEENGVRVNISVSGQYEVAYLDDAYSPWPNEQYTGYQGWTTILRIYVNSPVKWGITDYGLEGPVNHDAYLGPGGYYLNKADAIAVSKGDRRTFRLNAEDYLTLVTLDERGRYADNRGKVDVGITYLGQ